MRQFRLFVLVGGVSVFAGCFGPAAVAPPSYSPGAAADAAMSEYDTNKDGKLDAKELEACPALKSSLKDLDKDNDSAISRAELEARIREFADSKLALITVNCRVLRGDQQPLEGATVQFLPEKFHANAIKPASGKSDAHGNVELRTEGSAFPGLPFGFYRVHVSLKDGAGTETIPAVYNSQTTLGYQVRPGMRGGIEIVIR